MLEAGVYRLVARTGNGARLKEHLMASHTLAEDTGRIATAAGELRLVVIDAADGAEFAAEWDGVRRW